MSASNSTLVKPNVFDFDLSQKYVQHATKKLELKNNIQKFRSVRGITKEDEDTEDGLEFQIENQVDDEIDMLLSYFDSQMESPRNRVTKKQKVSDLSSQEWLELLKIDQEKVLENKINIENIQKVYKGTLAQSPKHDSEAPIK